MKSRNLALLLLLIIIVIAVIWWANRQTPTGVASVKLKSDGSTVHIQEGAKLESPKPNRRYKLGVLFPFLASPFWVNEAYGVLDECKKLGVDVVWLSADGYDNVDKQNNQMEDLATRRVDAILLAATSYTGTVPAVNRATSEGVPVFAHVTSSNTNSIVSAVIDDDLQIGRKQADYMGTALNGNGSVAMLNGPAGAEWAVNRVKGFKEVIASKFPGIHIVAERYGSPDRADALRISEDLLTTFPKLNGVMTVADGMAMGVVDAIRSHASAKKIILTTASFSKETIPYIQAGAIGINVDENPVLMGRTVVDTAVKALNGEVVPKTIYLPNPGITSANLNAVDATQQWAPDGWKIR